MKTSSLLPLAIVSALASPFHTTVASSHGERNLSVLAVPESPSKGYQSRSEVGRRYCDEVNAQHSHGAGSSDLHCRARNVLKVKKRRKRTVSRRCHHSSKKENQSSLTAVDVTSTASLAPVTVTLTQGVFPTFAAPGPALEPNGKKRKRSRTIAEQKQRDLPLEDPFWIANEGAQGYAELRRRRMDEVPLPVTNSNPTVFVTVSTAGASGIYAAAKEAKTAAATQAAATRVIAAASTMLAAATPASVVTGASQISAAVVQATTATTEPVIMNVPTANIVSSGRVLYYSSGSVDIAIPTPGVVTPPAGWASGSSPLKVAGLTTAGLVLASSILHVLT